MKTKVLAAVHVVFLMAGWVSPYDPEEQFRDRPYAAPSRVHWLGTDGLGRDQLSRLLHGGRVSLFSGIGAAVPALGMALVLGAAAGYFGGWADALFLRVTEAVLALPWIYLLLGARAMLPLRLSAWASALLVIAIVGGLGWARPARLIRGVVRTAKQQDAVLAARGFGATDGYLLRRHLLPYTFGVVRTQAGLLIAQFLVAEATLSFLGIGIAEPAASLGNLLAPLREYAVLSSYWWMMVPALVLASVLYLYQPE